MAEPGWNITEQSRRIVVNERGERWAEVTVQVPILGTYSWGYQQDVYVVAAVAPVTSYDQGVIEDAYRMARNAARDIGERVRQANPDHLNERY